jgi:vacuolar-type H+-ATPase subunit E/Vma4
MIAGSNQFQNTLKRLVAEAVDAIGSEEPIVRVGFKEASKNDLEQLGKSLPRGSKFVVENEPIDGLGGVVASDPQGKIVFNNSFRSRLERLDNQLFTLIASTLFSE